MINLKILDFALITLVALSIIAAFILGSTKMNMINTYIQCCDGSECSDTYYTAKDNKCHLSLCESSVFTDKKDCVYDGLNVSINFTNGGKFNASS